MPQFKTPYQDLLLISLVKRNKQAKKKKKKNIWKMISILSSTDNSNLCLKDEFAKKCKYSHY